LRFRPAAFWSTIFFSRMSQKQKEAGKILRGVYYHRQFLGEFQPPHSGMKKKQSSFIEGVYIECWNLSREGLSDPGKRGSTEREI